MMEISEQRKQQILKTVKNTGQRKKKMDDDKKWWKTQIIENDGEWPPIRFHGPTPPTCSRASQRVPTQKNHKERLEISNVVFQNLSLTKWNITWNCDHLKFYLNVILQAPALAAREWVQTTSSSAKLALLPLLYHQVVRAGLGRQIQRWVARKQGNNKEQDKKKGARKRGKQEQEQSLQCSRLFSLPENLRLTGEENEWMAKEIVFTRKRTNQKRGNRNKGNVGRRRRKITKIKRWKSNHEKMRKLLRKVIFWFLD